MEENIADTLKKTADVMHFLGQYRVCNALILLSRLMRARGIHTLDGLERYVERVEDVETSRASQ